MKPKENCWEIKKCGREPGGAAVDELGVCPAAVDTWFNGLNHGKNGGRICWAVAGTLCEGEIQGLFAMKIDTCLNCEVFKRVSSEEGAHFVMHLEDINMQEHLHKSGGS
jgi:hypothetical protein